MNFFTFLRVSDDYIEMEIYEYFENDGHNNIICYGTRYTTVFRQGVLIRKSESTLDFGTRVSNSGPKLPYRITLNRKSPKMIRVQ